MREQSGRPGSDPAVRSAGTPAEGALGGGGERATGSASAKIPLRRIQSTDTYKNRNVEVPEKPVFKNLIIGFKH